MGALKWGLKATLCNLRTIVYNMHFCGCLGPLSTLYAEMITKIIR